MAEQLTLEEKLAYASKAMEEHDQPAYFARLKTHGIKITELEASEYRALGEELLSSGGDDGKSN